jgi:hypothetical protein
VQNIHADWSIAFRHAFAVTNAVQLAQRYNQTVYPAWNFSIAQDAGRIRPYVRVVNLSNTGYEEITGVRMPSRSIIGGLALQIGH